MAIVSGWRTGPAAVLAACLVLVLMGFMRSEAGAKQTNENPERSRTAIAAFNKKYVEAHLKMDNAAIMAMWAEDGADLLPATSPMVGKPAIAKFLDDVTSQLAGYHMQEVEMDFRGIEVSGDWASEWAYEHQVIQPPDGKPAIDNYGKLLLVLHRETEGDWRVTREMWNQGMKP